MISVYEASNELEAQMILNLLDQSDISGGLSGTDLPGAVGELQAINLVSVVVQAEDVEESRQIILDWESSQTYDPPQRPVARSSVLFPFFLGAVLATGFVVWFTYSPRSTNGADLNQDGQQDEFYVRHGGRFFEWSADRNFDGEIDAKMHYSKGIPEILELDDNFDGRFETTIEYEQGYASVSRTDHDGDERADYIQRFHFDVPTESEFIGKSGHVVKLKQFSATGQLKEALLDEDADGIFDVTIRYDDFEEEIERVPYE